MTIELESLPMTVTPEFLMRVRDQFYLLADEIATCQLAQEHDVRTNMMHRCMEIMDTYGISY